MLDIIKKESRDMTIQAKTGISKLGEKYYVQKRVLEPNIFLALTDNWISFYIRYVTEVRQRREIRNKIINQILNEIQKSKNINIASTTLDITRFPEVKISKSLNPEN